MDGMSIQDPGAPLSPRERAIHLLSRLSFGATEESVEQVLQQGESAWLDAQLEPAVEGSPALIAALSELPTVNMDSPAIYEWVNGEPSEEELSLEKRRELNRRRRLPREHLLKAVHLRSVLSTRQVFEVLADFFRNHFNVSFTKGGVSDYLITDYENQVVRMHLLGTFADMLRASASHPAMLYFLDNHLSRRPPSKQELAEIERNTRRSTGSRQRGAEAALIAAQRGLNENYARELLELHTLGVDNYYKQRDVIAVAEALTGWTFNSGRYAEWDFRFRSDMHVEGPKKVLGHLVREDRDGGLEEGHDILKMLIEHKGTADFIAMKLVRYLVADQPPPDLVKSVAKVFRKSEGDIQALLRAIIESDDFWLRRNYRTKFKTPNEFLCSALRSLGAEIIDPTRVLRVMADMGQPLYHCDDPTGWYDTAESWLDPGVMARRWQFAEELAANRIDGVTIPPDFYQSLPAEVPRLWQHHLTKRLLPSGAGQRTRNALSTVTDQYLAKAKVADVQELGPPLVGLLLGSPEFQQQ